MTIRQLSARSGLVLLTLVCAALGAVARAQEADPPARVARLSDAEGSVSLQPAGVQDWAAATLNRPLTTGDRLWSDQNSRAELDVGDAVMRLGSSTDFSFLNLDDASAQMQITSGTLIVRVRDMQANQSYEIDTPNLVLSLQQPGEYRVDVSAAGDATVVKVEEGAAQALAGAQTVAIGTQQSVTFEGTQTPAYYSDTLGAPDDLDTWSAARERQVEDSVSAEYVTGDVPGAQDLDNNGRWQDTSDYGYVWMPTAVVVGWVPYRFGHWVWINPWGWTWVDNARWGFAPFHYGRWVQWNNAWCWVPGPRFGRPVYAPALVAWVGGGGPGTPAAFTTNVGWFPLGPREVYVPAARVSPVYLRRVNSTNTTLINNTYLTNVYQNAVAPLHYTNNRPAWVTTVPQNIFISSQSVGGHVVQLPPAVLAGAGLAAAAPAIVPIRQSVLGPSESRGVARPPATLLHRPVLVRTPPPRSPAAFDAQLAAIEANGGRPLSRSELAKLQPAAPAIPLRVIAPRGPVIAASTLPHRATAARVTNPSVTRGSTAPMQVASPPPPNLGERERTLQQNTLPPASHPSGTRAPAAGASTYLPTYAPPRETSPSSSSAWRSDRPPAVPQYSSPPPQHALSADDPTHASGHPSSLPVFHPPVGPDPGTAAEESRHAGQTSRTLTPAPPRAIVPTGAVPAAQPRTPAPANAQPSKEPRDSARHADPDTRERVVR